MMDQQVTNERTFNIENQHLSARLTSLRNEERLCDITFRLRDGNEIKAHKSIVAAFSNYVMNMCTQNTNKFVVALVVNLPTTSREDLGRILDFIYGVPLHMNWNELETLKALSKELLIPDLEAAIGEVLQNYDEDTKATIDSYHEESMQYDTETCKLEPSVKQEPSDGDTYGLNGFECLRDNTNDGEGSFVAHGASSSVNYDSDYDASNDNTVRKPEGAGDENRDENDDYFDHPDTEDSNLDIEKIAATDGKGCTVCGYYYARMHYGAQVCVSCERFFKRHHIQTSKSKTLKCAFDQNCEIDLKDRSKCQWCRLKKCREVGMKILDRGSPTSYLAPTEDGAKGPNSRKEPTRSTSPSHHKQSTRTSASSSKKKQNVGRHGSTLDDHPRAVEKEVGKIDEATAGNTDDFQFVTTARPKNLMMCYFCKQHIETERFVEHQKLCRKDRMFKCCVCEETFDTNTAWRDHLKTHSDTLFCDICYSETFSSQTELLPHKREHFTMDSMRHYHAGEYYGVWMKSCEGAMLLQCVLCDSPKMLYTSPMFLTQHIRKEHRGLPFKCSICGKIYTGSHGLRRHLDAHTGIRPRYLCSECGKVYSQQKQLKAHSVTHILGKPFYCKLCNTGFDKEGEMRIHSKTAHTDKMEHICSQCGRGFISRHLMKRHIETSHTQKHICSFCGKKFGRKTNLKTHERIHTSEKPYKCSVCNASFAQLASIQWHYKKNHPNCVDSSKSEFTKVDESTGQSSPVDDEVSTETQPAQSVEAPPNFGQLYSQPMYFNPYIGGVSN